MTSSEGVPQIFVVPERHFDPYLGVSAAELEFPVYCNYYLGYRLSQGQESHEFAYQAPGKVIFDDPPMSLRFHPPGRWE